MKTTFKIDDLFLDRWNEFPKPTPYSELSEEEQEQKFMDVLTNGLPNYNNTRIFSSGIKYSPTYYNRQHKNQLGDPFVFPKVPKNKKWYDTFR